MDSPGRACRWQGREWRRRAEGPSGKKVHKSLGRKSGLKVERRVFCHPWPLSRGLPEALIFVGRRGEWEKQWEAGFHISITSSCLAIGHKKHKVNAHENPYVHLLLWLFPRHALCPDTITHISTCMYICILQILDKKHMRAYLSFCLVVVWDVSYTLAIFYAAVCYDMYLCCWLFLQITSSYHYISCHFINVPSIFFLVYKIWVISRFLQTVLPWAFFVLNIF